MTIREMDKWKSVQGQFSNGKSKNDEPEEKTGKLQFGKTKTGIVNSKQEN